MKKKYLKYTLLLALLYMCLPSSAQTLVESLAKQYHDAQNPSVERFETAGKYIQSLFSHDQKQKAHQVFQASIVGATRYQDGRFAAYLHAIQAMNLRLADDLVGSRRHLLLALDYSQRTPDLSIKGYVAYAEGWLYLRQDQSDRSVSSFLRAANYLEKSRPSSSTHARLSAIYKELANVYANLEDLELQQKYSHKTVEYAEKQDNPNIIFDANMMMGYVHEQRLSLFPDDKDSRQAVERYYRKAINTYYQHKQDMAIPSNLSFVALNLANLYLRHYPQEFLPKAIEYANIAKETALKVRQADHIAAAYGLLSEIALQYNDKNTAKIYLQQSLAEINSAAVSDPQIRLSIYEALTQISEQQANFAEALSYKKEYIDAYKRKYDQEKLEITKTLEAQFDKERQQQAFFNLQLQAEKKEQQLQLMQVLGMQQHQQISNFKLKDENQRKQLELSQLEAERRQQQLDISTLAMENKNNEILHVQRELSYKEKINTYFFISILVVIILLALVLYALKQRNKTIKQREALHALAMAQEKQNANINTLTALLNGQELERARLARDLHDGLGGLLSGTKIQLSHFAASTTTQQPALLANALDHIDDAVQELRRVAHNLMPDLLTKYGLETALREFATRMSNPTLEIDVQFLQFSASLDSERALICYRIIQELVNNALKHAQPTQIIIQLVEEEQQYAITVEDDGLGFDISTLHTHSSAGLHNIASRIDFLKGQLTYHSQKDQGTSIDFHFPKYKI